MAKYAAFLRAVNLGRNRRVSGAELRGLFEEMGLENPESFRTSGNVVFETATEKQLEDRIEEALAKALGYEVPIYLRTATEIQAMATHQPFDPEQVDASKGKLQVMLLPKNPAKTVRDQVLALATDDDRLAFGDRELYWLPSGGTQQTELDVKTIEKLIGPTTMRTKGTIEQMAAKYFTA